MEGKVLKLLSKDEQTLLEVKRNAHKKGEVVISKLFKEGKVYIVTDKEGVERFGKCIGVKY